MIAAETITCIISIKIVTHIFAAETYTCVNATKTFNCIIPTETVTCIIETKRSTNISAAESTTNIIAIEHQNLYNCSRCWHLHNCYRKCQLHSSNRNCHLQNWLQKLSLAEMVPVRGHFSYNKEIEWVNEWGPCLRQNSFSMTCITQWRNSTVHCVNELYCIFIIKNKEADKEIDTYSTLDPHQAERMTQGWKNFYKVLRHCFMISWWI